MINNRTTVRLFNSGGIYGIICIKDSIITRDASDGSARLYNYLYNKYHNDLKIPDSAAKDYYNKGRTLYKNEEKLFLKNGLDATPITL